MIFNPQGVILFKAEISLPSLYGSKTTPVIGGKFSSGDESIISSAFYLLHFLCNSALFVEFFACTLPSNFLYIFRLLFCIKMCKTSKFQSFMFTFIFFLFLNIQKNL
jgi:hypothetical protein